jgi:hypothetical protein
VPYVKVEPKKKKTTNKQKHIKQTSFGVYDNVFIWDMSGKFSTRYEYLYVTERSININSITCFRHKERYFVHCIFHFLIFCLKITCITTNKWIYASTYCKNEQCTNQETKSRHRYTCIFHQVTGEVGIPESNYQISADHTALTIHSAHHAGTVWCIARNSYGATNAKSYIWTRLREKHNNNYSYPDHR